MLAHVTLYVCVLSITIQLHVHDDSPSCFIPLDITVVRNIINIDVSVLAQGCHCGSLVSIVCLGAVGFTSLQALHRTGLSAARERGCQSRFWLFGIAVFAL